MATDVVERELEGGLRLRLIRADDEPRLMALHEHLSRHTAYQRFFSAVRHLSPQWSHRLANVDYRTRLALVIEHHDGSDERTLIAVARYEPTSDPDVAEVALVVQDDWQGKGLGRLLLRALLTAAQARGIHQFRAYVLADNFRMLGLLSRHTKILKQHIDRGVVELFFEPLG